MKIKKNNYIDITNFFTKNACPNSHLIKEQNYFEYKGERYLVDGKKVVLDYSEEERRVAEWLENTFGGEIYLLPRINDPDGIKTPDYLWNHEYWDLKTIKKSGMRVIDNRLNGTKSQTNNYIIDVSKNESTDTEIINQIKKIYHSKDRS